MRFHPLFFGITGAAAFTAPIPRFSVSTCGSRTIPGLPVSLSEEVTAPSTDEVPAPSNEPEASLENSGDEALQPNDKDTGAEEASMGERKRIITRDRNTAYVGNLSTETTEETIGELFGAFGKVELVSIPRHKDGLAKGFAFVDMSTEDELENAIEQVNGQEIDGQAVRVSKSATKEEIAKKREAETAGLQKIYVGNIPFDCTTEELKEYFQEYGEVTDVFIPQDKDRGISRGFAFVTMKEEFADAAIEGTNGDTFGGRTLKVSVPMPKGERKPRVGGDRTKIYVGNLSFYTVGETVETMFSEFGTVHDCFMPEDPSSGGARGFAFVTMDKEAAEVAIKELHDCEVDGRIIRVNEAIPRGSRTSFRDEDED